MLRPLFHRLHLPLKSKRATATPTAKKTPTKMGNGNVPEKWNAISEFIYLQQKLLIGSSLSWYASKGKHSTLDDDSASVEIGGIQRKESVCANS
jgi:hypothetical protein